MNASNAKDYLPLVQALAEGEVIQMLAGGEWADMEDIDFVMPPCRYRIKPEPKEIWVNESGDVGYCFFQSEDEAIRHAKKYSIDCKIVRYREVIE